MLQVPTSLAGLLSLLAGCFTQPSFETFSMLLVGSVGRVRDRTVTGMLQAAGLAGVWHHSRAHDFFARRRWDPDALGLALLAVDQQDATAGGGVLVQGHNLPGGPPGILHRVGHDEHCVVSGTTGVGGQIG